LILTVPRVFMLALLLVLSAAALWPKAANADTTIDTIPFRNNTLCCFGYPDTPTYGQVVTVPTDDPYLESFMFLINMSNTVVFRGEVYAWDGAKATGTNLYESAPMRTSGSGTFEEITFEPGGIKLVPGQQYILFATVSKDYAPSGGTRGIWGMATTNPYNGGALQYDNNAGDINDLLTNPWDSITYGQATNDFAFRAVFTSEPPLPSEPNTKADCRNGGYKDFGFKNQGECIKAVNAAN